MRLYKVPMLCDYPEFRGQFIKSTMTDDIAFLDAKGKMTLFKSEIQGAIFALFRCLEGKPAVLPADSANPRPITLAPMPPSEPVQVRGIVSIGAYVESVERLARAIRG